MKRLLLIATGHDRPLGERGQAIEELGRLGDPTVVMPLIDGVLGCVCGAGRPLFQGIQRALVRLDARTVFLAGLDASDPQVRADTLDRIMYFPDRGLAPRCLQMLSDPNPRMREKAAAALASVGDESHVEVLGQRLDDDPDAFVRMAAAEALGAIAGPRAIEILRGGAARESHPIGQRTIEEAIERATRRTARRQGTRRR